MGIDTSIYSNLLAKPKSVAEYDAEAMQGQQNKLALQMGRAKMDEYQRGVDDEQQVRGVVSKFGSDTTANYNALLGAGRLKEAQAYEKTNMETAKAKRDAEKAEIEGHFKKFELAGQIMGGVNDQATWELARQRTAQVFGPEAAAQMPTQYDPALVEQKRAQAMTVKDQLEQTWKAKGFDLDEKKFAYQKENDKANRGVTIRGQDKSAATAAAGLAQSDRHFKATQEGGGGGEAQFTPAAISNAAARYNLDGTLPPMGMGKTGSAGRAAILNEAALQSAGIDGTEQRRNQLGAKGEASAKAASLRAYSAAGKEGQAIQATNTGLNHLDTVEQLAMAQRNGNTRLFNAIANKLAAETGQAAPTNLAAAITMVAPEVSKAVIGASGGQEERATFAKNFNPNGSPQQALEGIGVIKELMGGRLTEAQRTYERTVGKKDFRDTMLSPAARRVLDKAHGAAGAADIHAQADAILRGGK